MHCSAMQFSQCRIRCLLQHCLARYCMTSVPATGNSKDKKLFRPWSDLCTFSEAACLLSCIWLLLPCRFVATAQFLWSYCHSSHGVHHPTPADKVFAHVNVLAGHDAAAAAANSTGTSKAEQGSRASMMAAAGAAGGAHLAILQQRLPQLASALKAAQAAGTAVESGALTLATDAHQRAVAAAAHAAATASTAAAAAAAAAGLQSASGAAAHRQPATASGAKGAAGGPAAGSAAGGAGAQNTKVSAAAAAASSKLAASCEDAAAAAAAAAAVVAAMPDQAVLAAVLTELREALGVELALLQQRLAVLGRRAGALVEEVVQLHAACNSELAEWSHRRYVTECGAVAALERVIKAAAAAGKPLAHDLRLEVGWWGVVCVVG